MARKKPEKTPASVRTIPLPLPPTDQDRSVRRVTLDGSRRLLTIEAEDKLWDAKRRSAVAGIDGAIVRLRPPAAATDEQVEVLRAFFEKAGAERVTVLPRPRADVVPADAHEKSRTSAVGARRAVESLVEESNSRDKSALGKLCERVMAEVGL